MFSSLLNMYLLLLLQPSVLPPVMGKPERRCRRKTRTPHEFSVCCAATYSANVFPSPNMCIYSLLHQSNKRLRQILAFLKSFSDAILQKKKKYENKEIENPANEAAWICLKQSAWKHFWWIIYIQCTQGMLFMWTGSNPECRGSPAFTAHLGYVDLIKWGLLQTLLGSACRYRSNSLVMCQHQ